MFAYPWGDFHSLNLGWFLQQFKEWTEKIQEYLDNGGGTSENLANVIAPVFNAGNSYLTGDYVLYNDELYKALEPVAAGTWNPASWARCLVTEEMGSSASSVDNVARLMIAGQYSNTYNYQKYAICRYNDKLWMCNTNLPTGGEEWEPSHWDEITVGSGLTGLRRSADTHSNAIVDLQNIVGDGSLSGFTATNLTGAANELKTSLGSVEGGLRAGTVQLGEVLAYGSAISTGARAKLFLPMSIAAGISNASFSFTGYLYVKTGEAVNISIAAADISYTILRVSRIGITFNVNLPQNVTNYVALTGEFSNLTVTLS